MSSRKKTEYRQLILLLISGYCNHLILPTEIQILIKKYYTFSCLNMNTLLLCDTHLKLYNISSQKIYSATTNPIDCIPFRIDSQCIINNSKLPKYITNKYTRNEQHKNKISLSTEQLISNKWSIIFQIGHSSQTSISETCNLTAFHLDLLAMNDYAAYSFNLPSFPIKGMNKPPQIIYNKADNILYAMNLKYIHIETSRNYIPYYYDIIKCKSIYSLNCNTKIESEWKWNKLYTDLIYPRYDTSVCMVDNHRFISILGGIGKEGILKYAELYGINCNKSIKLKNMNKERNNAVSLYHNKYHRIIVGGEYWTNGIEQYDINKDEWIVIKDTLEFVALNKMWISKENPNILFLTGYKTKNYPNRQIEIHKIDLRTQNFENKMLINEETDNLQSFMSDISVLQL